VGHTGGVAAAVSNRPRARCGVRGGVGPRGQLGRAGWAHSGEGRGEGRLGRLGRLGRARGEGGARLKGEERGEEERKKENVFPF
jgi:hypothetical protein